jgi:hypothetical protein
VTVPVRVVEPHGPQQSHWGKAVVSAAARILRSRVHNSEFIGAKACVGAPSPAVVIFRGRAEDQRLARAQAPDADPEFLIHKSGIRRNVEKDVERC